MTEVYVVTQSDFVLLVLVVLALLALLRKAARVLLRALRSAPAVAPAHSKQQ